jgi:hypothetical protein
MNDHRTFAANHVIPAQAGTHLPASVSLPEEARSQKTLKNRVLAERWIPACAGMAREADVEIASTFVDTNRITASKAGVPGASDAAVALDSRLRGNDDSTFLTLL